MAKGEKRNLRLRPLLKILVLLTVETVAKIEILVTELKLRNLQTRKSAMGGRQ